MKAIEHARRHLASLSPEHRAQLENEWKGIPRMTEALNSPNDDAETPDAVETGKLENIVRGLRQYPAEELAKHGITLAPEKDVFVELAADFLEATGRPASAHDMRKGNVDDQDRAAIELLRTRFEQMIAERSKRDA